MFFIVLSPVCQLVIASKQCHKLTDDTGIVDQDMYGAKSLDGGIDDLLTIGY
jgi:hypothetical protein